MNIVYEKYDSIKEFVDTINSRNINNVFKGRRLSSEEGTYDFTGTYTLEQAKSLLKDGYKAPLKNIERGLRINKINKKFKDVPKVRPKNSVVGAIPHIPNSLLGLPQSMINLEKIPNKVKVVSINYDMVVSCSMPTEDIERAGIMLLSIVNALELRGYRVKLNVMAFSATQGDELAVVSIGVKDYRQHLDLLKLCFPLVHPSFFRRLGFKWLETVPNLTETGFPRGYGIPVSNKGYYEALGLYSENLKDFDGNSYYLSVKSIKSLGFNTNAVLKEVGLIKLIE